MLGGKNLLTKVIYPPTAFSALAHRIYSFTRSYNVTQIKDLAWINELRASRAHWAALLSEQRGAVQITLSRAIRSYVFIYDLYYVALERRRDAPSRTFLLW